MTNRILFQKVLFIGSNYKNPRGGIGSVLATYAQGIPNFKFLCSYNGLRSKLGNVFYFGTTIFQLFRKLIFDKNIEIVHLHGASKGSFYRLYIIFIISKYIFRKKVIYHLHAAGFKEFFTNTNKFIKKCVRHIMRKSDVVICLSLYWYQYLNSQFTTNRLLILNNPIPAPPNFDPFEVKSCSKLRLLFLGLIGRRKGVFDLLNVIVKYPETQRAKIMLTIGGNGDIAGLKEFIEKNHLQGCVEFAGWVSGERKHVLLSSCDVLVLPSYNEGLPISILEAMSYGKAIISTTVGGIPEIIKNDENGFLIEPGDVDQLKASIDKFIQKPSLAEEMGINSRNKVEDYLIANVLAKLETIYEKI